MRKLALIIPLALFGCMDPPPACMTPNESGVILAVNTARGLDYGGRGGPYPWMRSTVTVRMNNGVSRVCTVSDVDKSMFPIGERVNLALARRAL
jgi:hypothetical protein